MKLAIWVQKEMKRTGAEFKTTVLKALAEKSKVNILTVQLVERGGQLKNYEKAQQVSKATGGKVSVKELCEA